MSAAVPPVDVPTRPGGAPRITLIDAASAGLLLRQHFSSGDPGPVIASLAHVPELVGPTLPFLGAVLGPSWIPAREKEIVILRTSAVMGCRYCTEAHSVVALDSGLNVREVRALRGELPVGDVFTAEEERALVAWCDAVAQGAEADIRQARQVLDVDDARLVELTLLVATTVMLNRYATALALPTSLDVRERLLREDL
ncbi:alkylhydroperoxidase AhpD family core domain-containing protein [Modestobacter sp. DSM 44400]|uniref:carboxymuconolactone decarboxylase family protein n=1 Tax=Modestobacter sp. DSM 44400 TaxID=1550230 RepID=UPI000899622F|nr:carboxymuconolactone decarboxylase family protein [Modestobacter sp. DSM 44400]SDX71813.1 alkylhydroperoxidase AhpD family core domain-containing protein [Modestobacter sp. DSM 44400]